MSHTRAYRLRLILCCVPIVSWIHNPQVAGAAPSEPPLTSLATTVQERRSPPPRRPTPEAQQEPRRSSEPRRQDAREPQRRRPPPEQTSSSPRPTASEPSHFGLGLQVGWEAPMGNAVMLHFLPSEFFGIFGGIGYNTSGLKFGSGAQVLLPLSDTFGFSGGAAVIYSQGTTGSVSLDASFQPEGSATREPLTASKDYDLSSAFMGSVFAGLFLKMSESMRVHGQLSYNLVLSGNEVSFDDKIRYDEQVEIVNQSSFDEEFEAKAESIVQAGGLGFSVGITLML